MRYDVTFQVGGEERVERVDAPDAASAVEAVRSGYWGTTDLFELIQVHLLDDPNVAQDGAAETTPAGSSGPAR